jgi:hypothetical protein
MAERLLDFDPESGLKTFYDYDEADDRTIIRYEQDVEPILDANKWDRNHSSKKMGDGLVHVARVPVAVQLEWYVKHGVKMWDKDHRGRVNQLLDTDYKYLKRLPIQLGNYR